MLFVGDDWAEGHHDIEIVDDQGKVLARRRLPEGLEGVTRLHSLIAAQMPDEWVDRDPDEVAAFGEGRDRDRPRVLGRVLGRGWL